MRRRPLPPLLLLLPLLRSVRPCPESCSCAPRAVDCSSRNLTAVPPDIPPDVEALLLRGNQLVDLYAQLPALPHLRVLDLSANHIRQLGRGFVFHELGELRALNLSRNEFRTLFNGVFRGVGKLSTLAMTHVQIKFIEEHVFDGLRALGTLDLSHNQLNAIFPEWFRDLENLETLHLENNHVSYVNGGTFASLRGLRHLFLSGNKIRGVSDHAFDGLANVTALLVEDNQLTRVPSSSLRATTRLRVLKLGGNFFARINTEDFADLPLEEAFVENIAELVLVDRGAFRDLPLLRTLHLHHNPKLRYIDPGAFFGVPNLRILSLHANNLSALSKEVVRGFQKPLQISLFENPLLCDCNVKWIHDVLNANSRIRMLRAERMTCDRPSDFHQVRLKYLNRTQIPDNCPPVLVGSGNSSVDKKIGNKHVFQCRAHGIPAPGVHWILPNGAVANQTSNDSHLHLDSPGSLTISHLKPRDSGVYTCVAENPLGEAVGVIHLTVENIDINLFPLGVASTFVTVVWNGTARNAFPEYEIVYRKEDADEKEHQSVTVSQFFRSYTINNLQPRSRYKFCIGVKSKEDRQYVQFSCTWVRTRDESFMFQGIHHTSNVAVAAVLTIITVMTVVVCLVIVAARKYRQRHYDSPEKSLVSNMAQIPLENLSSPLVSQTGS